MPHKILNIVELPENKITEKTADGEYIQTYVYYVSGDKHCTNSPVEVNIQ